VEKEKRRRSLKRRRSIGSPPCVSDRRK
jgi:hypothetical protein